MKSALTWTSDLLAVLVGLVAIGMSVRSLLAAPQNLVEVGGTLSLILASLGLLLLASVVERRSQFGGLLDRMRRIEGALDRRVEYAQDAAAAVNMLTDLAKDAQTRIVALGSRSRSKAYLRAITNAVRTRGVEYVRVIDGRYIYHELHVHLRELIGDDACRFAWLPEEKYGNMTVSESQCVIAFPEAFESRRFRALRLRGAELSSDYSQYVMSFLGAGKLVTYQTLEALCKDCCSGKPTTQPQSADVQR